MAYINKYEEALENIMIKFDEYQFIPQTTIPDYKIHFYDWFNEEIEILEELIKKENSLVPIMIQDEYFGDFHLACPNCNEHLYLKFYSSNRFAKYCPYCGQKLDVLPYLKL